MYQLLTNHKLVLYSISSLFYLSVLKNEGRRNVISQKRRKVYEFEDGIIEGLIAKFTLLAI